MEIQQYDNFAVKHLAAFNAFSTIFEAQNPRPLLAKVSRDTVSLIIVLALALVMVAAVIVSGSRTIDEFAVGNPFIGVVAFVMVEGGIMAYAFFRARRSANKDRLQNTVRWATAGLIFTVIVGLGANVDSTLRAHGVLLPDEVKTALNLLVALSAPALAFISSDVLAIELMATDIKRREAQREYEIELGAWEDKRNVQWKAQQKNWGVKIHVEVPALPAVHERSPEHHEREKKVLTPGVLQAIEWLNLNDPDAIMSVREASMKAGVSVGTISTAKKYLRDNGGAS